MRTNSKRSWVLFVITYEMVHTAQAGLCRAMLGMNGGTDISNNRYSCTVNSSKPKRAPFIILEYNMFTSGVDNMDQNAHFYNMLNVNKCSQVRYVIHDILGHVKGNDQRRLPNRPNWQSSRFFYTWSRLKRIPLYSLCFRGAQ